MFKKITLDKFKLCVLLELYEIAPYTGDPWYKVIHMTKFGY